MIYIYPHALLKRVKLIVSILLLPVAFAWSQSKNANDTLKIDRLLDLSFEELMNVMVITPTQSSLRANNAPATVKVVTQEQLQLRGYHNLAEVLNDLVDITVQDKTDPQHYNKVSIRGVGRQDFFIIMLDGVRVSSPTNEPLPILENFPIYFAKQIEIVYGPGSALYGADAMAGVVNIITRKPGDADSPGVAASVTGGSNGYSNASVVIQKKMENDFKISLAGLYSYDAQPDFSKIYQDQFSMTSHETGVFNTAYGIMTPQQPVQSRFESPVKAYNIYASLEKNNFNMKVLRHYVATPTSTTFTPNDGVYNKNVFYGQGVTTASANYTADIGNVKSISTLTGSFYSVNPKSNYRNLYGSMEHGYKYSTGSMMKIEEQLHYTKFKKVNLIGGITYELFQSVPKTPELQSPVSRKTAASGTLLNTVAENNPSGIEAKFFPITYSNIGIYAQSQYFPIERLSFTTGIRFDHNTRFGSTINPRVGSVFHFSKKTTLKALYGTAYWAPSPMISFESYGSFYTLDNGTTYRSDHWHLPNPGLKPVTSQTFEFTIEQKFSKRFNAQLTAYHTNIDNLIEQVSDNENTNLYNNKFLGWQVDFIEVPVNKRLQVNYGGNLSLNTTFTISEFECIAYSSVSYLEGKESKPGSSEVSVEQASITPWQYRVGMDGKSKSFYFSARLLHAGKQRMVRMEAANDNRRQTLNGYTLVNMSMGYTFRKNITTFINVQNLLNEHYMVALGWNSTDFDGAPQNPLRAMLGIKLALR